MKRLKNWLINRILPLWARQELQNEIEALRQENAQLQAKLTLARAYIDGQDTAMRRLRKVVVVVGEK